ncbi:MAG: oligosaccharide flippase family protein [Brevinematia bacterium]
MSSSFFRSVFFTFVGFGLLMLSNVIFNVFSARFLGPVAYGEFNSFFYLLLAFSQPNNSLQLAVAKAVAENDKLKNIIHTVFFIGILLFLFLSIFFPFILRFYSLSQYLYSLLGAVIVFLWLVCAGIRGIYQGRMNFFIYGMNIGLEGVFRVIALFLLFYLGLRLEGAVLSSVFAGILALILLLAGLYRDIRFEIKGLDFSLIKETMKAFSILFPFGLIFQIDLTLSQHFLSSLNIGYLSACSLYGKNLVILSMVFANVVFSFVIKNEDGYFIWGNILTAIVFLGAYLFTLFFGKWLILFIQGESYLKAKDYLPLYILFSFPVGIMQQMVNYSFAKDIKSVTFLIWGILLVVIVLPFVFFSGKIEINLFLIFLFVILVISDLIIAFFILMYNKKILLTKSKK